MSLPYGPPQPVSPVIRGARFALLFAGIIYGVMKQGLYSRMEQSYREEQARLKVIRDIELAKVKAKIAEEEKKAVELFEKGKLF